MGTLAPVWRTKTPSPVWRINQSSQNVLPLHLSTSSSVPTSKLQTDENTFAVPFSDTTNIYDSVFDDDFLIALRKGKHNLILSLAF